MLNRILGKFYKEKQEIKKLPVGKEVEETRGASRRDFLKALGGLTLATMGASTVTACADEADKPIEKDPLEKFFDNFDMRALDPIPEDQRGKKLEIVPMDSGNLLSKVNASLKDFAGFDLNLAGFVKTGYSPDKTTFFYWGSDSTELMEQLQKIDKDAEISSYQGDADGKQSEYKASFTVNGADYKLYYGGESELYLDGPAGTKRWNLRESGKGILEEIYDKDGQRHVNGYDAQGNKLERIYQSDKPTLIDKSFTDAKNGQKLKMDSLSDIRAMVAALDNGGLLGELAMVFPEQIIQEKGLEALIELIKILPSNNSVYFGSLVGRMLKNSDRSSEFQNPTRIIDEGLSSIENETMLNVLWIYLMGYETYLYFLQETSAKVKEFELDGYIVEGIDNKTGKKYIVGNTGMAELDEDLEVSLAKDNEKLAKDGAKEALRRIKI